MKKIALITAYVLATVVLLLTIYRIAFTFGNDFSKKEAVTYCMQWRIPGGLVINGEIYCVTEVMRPLADGTYIVVPRAWSQKDMEEIFGIWKAPEELDK